MPKKIDYRKLVSLFPEFSPMRIKYKDIFGMKPFYEALHEWLQEYGWKDAEEPVASGDHWESFYGERIGQGGAREIWIQWRVQKPAPGGAGRLRYYLDMDFHCLALVNTEVIVDGKKVKTNKGEVELTMKAYIDEEYKKDFAKSPVLKSITNFFSKRIYHEQLEMRKKELYQEIYILNNFIKQWFKLKRYLPYEEAKTFFITDSYPSHLKK